MGFDGGATEGFAPFGEHERDFRLLRGLLDREMGLVGDDLDGAIAIGHHLQQLRIIGRMTIHLRQHEERRPARQLRQGLAKGLRGLHHALFGSGPPGDQDLLAPGLGWIPLGHVEAIVNDEGGDRHVRPVLVEVVAALLADENNAREAGIAPAPQPPPQGWGHAPLEIVGV